MAYRFKYKHLLLSTQIKEVVSIFVNWICARNTTVVVTRTIFLDNYR